MRRVAAPLALTCSFVLAASSLGRPQGDKGVLSMTAEEVARAYQQNETFVDEYLTSKAIQVGGPVVRVFRVSPLTLKEEVQYVVVLESQRRLPVHCFFPAKERKQLAGLRPGEQVTVRGTCQGKADSRDPGGKPAAAGGRGAGAPQSRWWSSSPTAS
jgi:hypothetical protein